MTRRKLFINILKILIAVGLIVLVFSRLDWEKVKTTLMTAQPGWLFAAVLIFILSQVLSVFRLDILLRSIRVHLKFKANSQLYLLGMFYNFFLPGGIGGDAYKIYLLNKSHGKSLKSLGKVIFIDRFLGILAIGILLSILVLMVKTPYAYHWNILAFIVGLTVTAVILFQTIKISKIEPNRIGSAFVYSIFIQAAQLLSILFILYSLGIHGNITVYLTLFLVSSVLSVISFAGLGIREAVFFFGASILGTDPNISAVIALIFSLITALTSLFGIIFLWKGVNLVSDKTINHN